MRKFLDFNLEDIEQSILTFREKSTLQNTESHKQGTLIFTGTSPSLQDGPLMGTFSSLKPAVRSLSQSLGKEFGNENIQVSKPDS
ncbi:hypothetical protein AN958_07438 [Leucoagaricus sp. SymC.cos]|nr:hypothetical protein AN958_07438 [Leucoagaricus sp. SymC.cos]